MNESTFSKQQLLEDALFAWEYQNVGDACDILDQLDNDGVSGQFSASEKQEITVKMQWVAFATLSEEEELALIKNHLGTALYDRTFDLELAFRLKETATPAVTWIDEVVPKLIDALLKNDEKIGTRELAGSPSSMGTGNSLKPTISNWLRDYTRIYGMDKQDRFVVRQYMTSSSSVASLSPEDKRALERLLSLFESIKVFSIEQILREAERLKAEEEQGKKQSLATTPQAQEKQPPVRQPMPVPPRRNAFPSDLKTPNPEQSNITPPAAIASTQKPGPILSQIPPSNITASPIRPTPTKSLFPQSPRTAPIVEKTPEILRPAVKTASQQQESTSSPYLGDLIGHKNIRAALQLNPKVSNQVVSSAPLEILGQGSALPPTVQNWILDYRVRFGVSGHTKEEREQFLHRSVNGRKLSQEERSRVAAIIQSYDENTLLPVSEKNGEIVFSEVK